MKNTIQLLLLVGLSSTWVQAQIISVPDPVFKALLLSSNTTNMQIAKDLNGDYTKIDQNNDGQIQVSEAENISYFYHTVVAPIQTYEGITNFSNLAEISLSYNPVPTELDLSGMLHLKSITCFTNNLAGIDVNGCAALETLNVDNNFLTYLNLSGLEHLTFLDCSNNTGITSLDLAPVPNLKYLGLYNDNVTSIDLTNQIHLENLECGNNELSSLTVENCAQLKSLSCPSNHLQDLDVSHCLLLETFICDYNPNLQHININNGFNWVPNLNFSGHNGNSASIETICTSAASIDALHDYYADLGAFPVISSVCADSLGINENQIPLLGFSPNPAKDKISFSEDVERITIYNHQGTIIRKMTVNGNTIDVADLNPGCYLLNVKTSKGDVFIKKLIHL